MPLAIPVSGEQLMCILGGNVEYVGGSVPEELGIAMCAILDMHEVQASCTVWWNADGTGLSCLLENQQGCLIITHHQYQFETFPSCCITL